MGLISVIECYLIFNVFVFIVSKATLFDLLKFEIKYIKNAITNKNINVVHIFLIIFLFPSFLLHEILYFIIENMLLFYEKIKNVNK